MQQIWHRFDPRAAFEFYRDLATLPVDGLVDGARCPRYAFWGSDDEEVALVMPTQELADGLRTRGIAHQVIPELDHEGLNARVEVALDGAIAWLSQDPGAVRRSGPRVAIRGGGDGRWESGRSPDRG